MSKKGNTQTRVAIRKKRKLRKWVYFVFIPILIALLGVVGYGGYLYFKAESIAKDSHKDDGREKSDLRVEKVDPDVDNVSVLIMGVDESDHRDNAEDARTDALILATFNKDDKSVKLHSIPRDSYVYIPEVGYEDKINHAHAYGDHHSTIETVENLLNIPVDYWVKLNFQAFVDVIDAIDGVEVDVPYEFRESDSNDKRNSIHLLPGKQTLNGEEALAFARTRKHDNDIERGKRQLEIIESVVDKATDFSSILKLDNIFQAVGDNIETNMLFSEMKSFAAYGMDRYDLSIETYTLEGTDYQPGSTYYWHLDDLALEETKELLKDHLDLSDSSLVEKEYEQERATPNPEHHY